MTAEKWPGIWLHSHVKWLYSAIKGVFDWLYSRIRINRIKTLFNLIDHNSYQDRRKTQFSYTDLSPQ